MSVKVSKGLGFWSHKRICLTETKREYLLKWFSELSYLWTVIIKNTKKIIFLNFFKKFYISTQKINKS